METTPPPNELTQIDHLRFRVVVERSARCQAEAQLAQQRLQLALAERANLEAELLARYAITPADSLDIDTGRIMRQPKSG